MIIFNRYKNEPSLLQIQKANGTMLKKVFAIWVMMYCSSIGFAQDKKSRWMDSAFQTLTTKEKIGQLFVLPVSAYDQNRNELIEQIKDYGPGGIHITRGGPLGTALLINALQRESAIPLLVGIEAEWGLGQTLDSLMAFPKPLLLGALQSDTLIYQLATEIARQMKTMGIHINFAPNADINLLASDPLRYLGRNKNLVADKSVQFMKGLQDHGILACAEYQPYAGNDKSEFKFDFVKDRVDTLSFFPYNELIKEGIGGVLTSNLHFSLLTKKKPTPAPLSSIFISDILKRQMAFEGITFTHIPYFHSLAGKAKGESEKLAFEVGNDMLIDPFKLSTAVKKIESAIKKSPALIVQLDNSVKRILAAKYDAGLYERDAISTDHLIDRIDTKGAEVLKLSLAEAAITVAKNDREEIPIKILDNKRFALLTIGQDNSGEFDRYLSKYTSFTSFSIRETSDTTDLAFQLKAFDHVVVALYTFGSLHRNEILSWVNQLAQGQPIILCSFGNPFDLALLESLPTIITGYTDEAPIPQLTAQIIFGSRQGRGLLPLELGASLREGQGKPNARLDRLGYGIPEQVGMDSKALLKIKSIMGEAIRIGATPGCEVLVAKDGQVVLHEVMGFKTYDPQDGAVTENTIYDLASVTKVAATLQAIMFLYDKGLLDIYKKASVYLPELKGSNKKDMSIKDILTHQAGLWPFLPFWAQTMKDHNLMPEYYSHSSSDEFPIPVAENLFAHKTMKDSLWLWIANARVREKDPRTPYNYTYSDMGFYILHRLAEKLLNQPLQDFLSQNFYEPLGAVTTGFLPLQRFPATQIAPTEADKQFRGSVLTGYVHDQGAAMHGGIAGHAGLFSNATDLAKLGQMWLQKGHYGGLQYLKPETIELFSTKQYADSRRGLGWDKPAQSDWNSPTSLFASPKTFGHTGFTGTAIWVDPEFNLVYIFLSNRVYPDMFNNKLLTSNIRPRIQDVVYQSIFEYRKHQN